MNSVSSRFSRRQALWLMGGLASSLALHACSQSSSSQSTPLISGVNPWTGHSGHYVATGKNLFKEEGIDVQEVFFQSASESITGFLAGRVDLAWVTSGDAIEMIHKDPTIRIIYVVDYSDGADGIIGRGIQRPQDLKGKTIARENLLFENVLLRAYLDKGGLTEQDITIKDMTAADSATAFAAKRVDAAVSYEPWLTKAAKEGGGEVIFSTKGTNLIADVIATRQKVIETRKADVLAYLRAVDKAVKQVNAGDAAAIDLVASKLNVSKEEAKAQFAGVKILDLNDNKTMAFNSADPNNVMKNFQINLATAVDMKLIPGPIDLNALYDDSLVKSL
jgi:NitT/TauT family transport system substrate-binding protein